MTEEQETRDCSARKAIGTTAESWAQGTVRMTLSISCADMQGRSVTTPGGRSGWAETGQQRLEVVLKR